MSLLAFLLVFSSVFLHAAWNMLSKATKPSMAFYTLMSGTAALIWLPFFLCSKVRFLTLPWQFHVIMLVSITGEVIYMLGLAKAYRWSDISFVYPVVRALPVLMVAGTTLVLGLGKTPGMTALGGMLLITAGCLLMPLKKFSDFSLKQYCSPVIGYILLGAVGTTVYTVCDSSTLHIIRDSMHRVSIIDTLAYLFLIESGMTLGELLVTACSPLERKLLKHMAFHSFYPILAGCCSSSAYGLVLLSMLYVTNVSYIQAFRQMSLPIGFLAGMVILKEKGTVPKMTGMLLILAGLLFVALG